MPGFMLDTEQLRQSELWAISTGEEFKAAVGLWCRAWLQKPPGSLPHDDRVLASWSGAGKRWAKVREVALRGFVLCSDGRLYHPVLCQDAHRAWGRRTSYRERASNAAAVRWEGRKQSSSNASSNASGMLKRAQVQVQRERQGDTPAAPAAVVAPPPSQPPPEPGLFDSEPGKPPGEPPAVTRLLDKRTFADWRIMVGKRCFVGQDERAEWHALFAAEGWDSMSQGYAILAAKHPEPAKLFLSMFQEIRE